MSKHRYRPSKAPIVRRVKMERGKIGAAFQEMMDFIVGRTVKRMEIVAVAESTGLERTSAKKMRRRVVAVAREHRLVVELAQPILSADKRRRGA